MTRCGCDLSSEIYSNSHGESLQNVVAKKHISELRNSFFDSLFKLCYFLVANHLSNL